MKLTGFRPALLLVAGALALAPIAFGRGGKKEGREEGVYAILVDGREIGREKYAHLVGDESASSTSVLDFRNPSGAPLKLHFETQLEMDGQLRPRTYKLKTDVDGTKGFMFGSFSPNQAMFEYGSAGAPKRSGMLVGNDYTLLDTNIFHHFIFLGRRFKFNSKEKVQRFEVVIPQESDSGVLKIREVGREALVVRGKRQETHHLEVDSGAKLIELWIDGRRTLHKIAVPSLRLEVLRSP